MSKKRGKRPGLRARSKNARTVKPKAKASPSAMRVARERELIAFVKGYLKDNPQYMRFVGVTDSTPREGALLLVKLTDGTFRFGMNLMGRFANYEYNAGEFVTMAHPERITHWMEVNDPVPFTAKAEASEHEAEFQAEGEAPSIMDAALAAGEAQDRAEDVYV